MIYTEQRDVYEDGSMKTQTFTDGLVDDTKPN